MLEFRNVIRKWKFKPGKKIKLTRTNRINRIKSFVSTPVYMMKHTDTWINDKNHTAFLVTSLPAKGQANLNSISLGGFYSYKHSAVLYN